MPHYKAWPTSARCSDRRVQLADEYGETWEPGAESLAEFEELCRWMGGSDCDGKGLLDLSLTASRRGRDAIECGDYRDPEGFLFTDVEFS
ncbi:MAG: hypothetical protein ACLTSX_00975 [Collinsella sp.]